MHNAAVQPAQASNHTRDIGEVAFTFALIVFILWIPRPQQGWLSLVALAWILGSTFLLRENRKAVELGMGGFMCSLFCRKRS